MNRAQAKVGWLVFLLAVSTCGASDNDELGAVPNEEPPVEESCESDEVCSGECVDLSSSFFHCGSCNRPCLASEVCIAGACEACSETTGVATATSLPVDVVVVVDSSGSMYDELVYVQESMNDFVSAITTSGVDARVVLITPTKATGDSMGICIPAPLGSGSCPADENLPTYQHVDLYVGSYDPLSEIVATYPQWQATLRPNSLRVILAITDDDSFYLPAASFTTQLLALDSGFADMRFHAIVSPYAPPYDACTACTGDCASCDPCCTGTAGSCWALPAQDGTVYKELVSATGGILGNLCTQDFNPIFQDIATAVVEGAAVPCSYRIPEAPEGGSLDYSAVDVMFSASQMATPESIPQVDGSGGCGDEGGWYFEPPQSPTTIELCSATCTAVQTETEGSVSVTVGCTTHLE